MRRVTRSITGEPVLGAAPEKIADAVEDLVTAVERALVEDGVDGIGLEEKVRWLGEAVTHIVGGFADARVGDWEERVDQQLATVALLAGDVLKRGPGRGGAS